MAKYVHMRYELLSLLFHSSSEAKIKCSECFETLELFLGSFIVTIAM